jgi:hypothetical protein
MVAVAVVFLAVAVAASAATVGSIATVSQACSSSQNAEVQQAIDPAIGYVYELWMGCGGIAFARSRDGGRTFDKPISMPGTPSSASGTWDPAIAAGPDGDVYAVYIVSKGGQYYPVVATSFDHGATFPQVTSLVPPDQKNWGDRPFIAVDPSNPSTVYVTWDYGPSRSSISYLCASGGSCAFKAGDLNTVIQRSTDHGKTFGPIVHLDPAFPASGGDAAPMVVEPSGRSGVPGRVDVLIQTYNVLNPSTFALGPAIQKFTYSTDGGQTWATPSPVGASAGTMSLAEWWINGSLAADAAGNLYASWDTQGTSTDVGWTAYSTDHGLNWSAPIQATPDGDNDPHITQVTGGAAGQAYVGVLSDASLTTNATVGYSLTLRPFSIGSGFTTAPLTVSPALGDPNVWPGDTFGLTTVSPSQIAASWGSAIPGNKKSQVFATTINY